MAQASRFLRVIVPASKCNWSHGFRNWRTVGGFRLSRRFSRAFFALASPWAGERYQNETVEKGSRKGRCGKRKIDVEDCFWLKFRFQRFGNVSFQRGWRKEWVEERRSCRKRKDRREEVWRKVTFILELMERGKNSIRNVTFVIISILERKITDVNIRL